jgi:trehalose 6-phosphate synthase
VNPHDIAGLKDAITTAISLPRGVAARRMKAMRRQIVVHNVEEWSASFLTRLKEVCP